jgi:hypothetical protein
MIVFLQMLFEIIIRQSSCKSEVERNLYDF